MSVEYYVGIDAPAIWVESGEDLREALDVLQTQVMDNIGDESPMVMILQDAMSRIEDECNVGPVD